MKLSKPEEYIKILLDDFTKKTYDATHKYFREVYCNRGGIIDAQIELNKELNRIEEVKNEILEICNLGK